MATAWQSQNSNLLHSSQCYTLLAVLLQPARRLTQVALPSCCRAVADKQHQCLLDSLWQCLPGFNKLLHFGADCCCIQPLHGHCLLNTVVFSQHSITAGREDGEARQIRTGLWGGAVKLEVCTPVCSAKRAQLQPCQNW